MSEFSIPNWFWVVVVALTILTAIFKFGKWFGEVNSDRKQFREFMDEMKTKIDDILSRLQPTPITSASPIRLTELGKRISENISAKSWANETAKQIVDETKDMDSLQIQEVSFHRAKSFEPDAELLQKMRDSAFEEGIELDRVRDVFGVELRDCLLRLHDIPKPSLDD